MVTLSKITPRPQYKLFLLYEDGVSGEVDLSHLVGQGVFSLWNDPATFETVTIGDHSAIRWSDDVELCSDALYLQITGKTAEKMGFSFSSTDQFVARSLDWLSQKWGDLHIEFHKDEGWQVSTCFAEEIWGEDSWIRGDGSLHSALLRTVEIASR